MKKGWIITVAFLGIFLGGGAFLYLNQPTQLLIRKSFKAITGYEILPAKNLDAMRDQNKALEVENKLLRAEAIQIDEALKTSENRSQVYKEERDAIRSRLRYSEKALLEAKADIQYLSPVEQIELHDGLTEGITNSSLISFQGMEMVLTELGRIKQTNEVGVQHNLLIQQIEIHKKDIRLAEEERDEAQNRNVLLAEKNKLTEKQLENTQEQLENCEETIGDAIRRGRNWFWTGVAAIGVAIFVVVAN